MYGLGAIGSNPDCGLLDMFSSRCWSFGVNPLPAPTIATVPPVAPQTEAAMTVPGVWTPGYAVERTNREVSTEADMVQAAVEARTLSGRYEGGAGLPFGDPNEPDPDSAGCLFGLPCWSLWAVGGLAVAAVLLGVSRGRR